VFPLRGRKGSIVKRLATCLALALGLVAATESATSCEKAPPAASRPDPSRPSRRFGFAASVGSDWHGPGESWLDLGGLPTLPAGVEPVWDRW